jgi:hypothetical protein
MLLAMLAGCGAQSPTGATSPAQPQQATGELAPAAARAEDEGIIEPEADAALRRMSDYLDNLQSFRVDTTTTDELVTKDGQKVQFVKETKVAVRRPDKLWAERTGPAGHVTLRYNGKQISVHSPEMGIYAIARAPSELKSTIDYARDELGIDAPAGDLVLPHSYQELIDGVLVGRYIGREPIGDVHAHHLAMSEKDVDWQIWIKDGADAVPIRYVITTKDLSQQPQFTAELHNWRADPALPDEQFAFKPPADAKQMTFDELQKVKLKLRSGRAGQQPGQ